MDGPQWIKLYPEEILGKAEMVALSDDQLGKLVRLWSIAAKEGCTIPSDLKMVASILRAPRPETLEWVRRFFRASQDDPGVLVSERLLRELHAYTSKCATNKVNGSKGGITRAANAKAKAQASAKRTLKQTLGERSSEIQAELEKEVTSLRSVTKESSLRSDSCSEPPLAPSSPPPLALGEPSVIDLPCVGNGSRSYRVTQAQVDGWAVAYPGLEVLQELRKAKVWLEANPRKGKTSVGMGRFLVSWLSRAQDSPRVSGGARASPQPLRRCATAEEDHRAQVSQLHFASLPLAEPQP